MDDDQTNENGRRQDQPNGKLGRRALMLGAATGVGAAAALVAGASPARAGTGDGGNVQLGQNNSGATATTYISTTGGDGLDATTSADGSYGVNGESSGSGGIGVLGQDFGDPLPVSGCMAFPTTVAPASTE